MRATCYSCFRPADLCLCGLLPRVPNRTELVVLQHPRERMHPFGSARMLVQALERAELHVARRGDGKAVLHPLNVRPGAALVYPAPGARSLESLKAVERPEQLVVLDGTWSQAHRLYKDNPWLWELPHYRIEPVRGSRYLVRKEPKPHCLSTLEASVDALTALEGELPGLQELIGVFERMNAQQVALRRVARDTAPRRKRVRLKPPRAVPPVFYEAPERVVMVYGESAELTTRTEPWRRELLQCVAVRLGSGALFQTFVQPGRGSVSDEHLARLELTREALQGAVEPEHFAREFMDFVGPDAVLVAWNPSTFRLLVPAWKRGHDCVQLKAVYCNWRGGGCGMLEDVMAQEGIDEVALALAGRARRRLGQALGMARWLAAGAAAAQAAGTTAEA